ncbi:hypothetical protein KFE25_013634 [Diacronema lutheri]|uniref:RCC1-like domain-containing protein n=1 Tax=Diacronema lutheri TaxID=2081491 RepID=A0A8J5XGQ7_DIALT|nr:hypothetical protein KFE25_013634 [Diacronema lutheri]
MLDDGSVKCWGSNSDGQLGQGDTLDRGDGANEMGDDLAPILLGTNRTAVKITAGEAHTCALLNDGSVKCWGDNGYGQLGQGDGLDRGDGANDMGDNLAPVLLGTNRTAVEIVAGGFHTCALLDDGSAKCWGDNDYGQLGQGDGIDRGDGANEMGDDLAPILLGTNRTAVEIAAGGTHTCALLDDGSAKCWGDNSFGQLGQGNTFARGDGVNEMGDDLAPVLLGTGRTAVEIVAGESHNCALLDDGSAKCWGNNFLGRLGQGDALDRGDGVNEMGDDLAPILLGTNRTAVKITAGASHNCALLDDGSAKCWGSNGKGRLGQGDVLARGDAANEMGDDLAPILLGTNRTAVKITAGASHTCALLDNGSVKCWGDNDYGQLGQGDKLDRGDTANEMGDDLAPVEARVIVDGELKSWNSATQAKFAAAVSSVLDAPVIVLGVVAASDRVRSVRIRFVIYDTTTADSGEVSVRAKLRDPSVVEQIKAKVAKDTGFIVESDIQVQRATAYSEGEGAQGRTIYTRTGAIVGGVIGCLVLCIGLPVVLWVLRRRQLAAKSQLPPLRGGER